MLPGLHRDQVVDLGLQALSYGPYETLGFLVSLYWGMVIRVPFLFEFGACSSIVCEIHAVEAVWESVCSSCAGG